MTIILSTQIFVPFTGKRDTDDGRLRLHVRGWNRKVENRFRYRFFCLNRNREFILFSLKIKTQITKLEKIG